MFILCFSSIQNTFNLMKNENGYRYFLVLLKNDILWFPKQAVKVTIPKTKY